MKCSTHISTLGVTCILDQKNTTNTKYKKVYGFIFGCLTKKTSYYISYYGLFYTNMFNSEVFFTHNQPAQNVLVCLKRTSHMGKTQWCTILPKILYIYLLLFVLR